VKWPEQHRYEGRIFIVGSGPSLHTTEGLAGLYPTFGSNRLDAWPALPFLPTFYACLSTKVASGEAPLEPRVEQARYLVCKREDGWLKLAGWTSIPAGMKEFHDSRSSGSLVNTPAAMSLMCVQIALALGFTDVYLVGCDNTRYGLVFDGDEDRYHGNEGQQGIVDTYWRGAADYYQSEGICITDCTPGGRLSEDGLFPYKGLHEALMET
jgi:hypothetical protein